MINCKTILFALACLVSMQFAAQDFAKADSLLKVMKSAKHDSVVTRIQFDLADIFIFTLPDSAAYYVENALQLAIGNKDSLHYAQAYNYKGIISTNRAHYLTAIEHYQEALKWYRLIHDKSGCGLCTNNIGVVYAYMEDNENAIKNYLESYELSMELGKPENAALSLFNICSEYLELKDYAMAEQYMEQLELLRADNESVISTAAIRAQLHAEKHQPDSAEKYLNLAFLEFEEEQDDYMKAALEITLAEVRIDQGRFTEAESIIIKSLEFARMNEFNEIAVDLLETEAKLYEKQGRPDKALAVHKEYLATKDSVDKLNDFSRISELNMKYETEKHELEIVQQNYQLEQKSLLLLVTLIGLSGLVVIVFLALFNLIKKRRLNAILRTQNVEIRKQRQKIISSINYARRIQNSILMPEEELKSFFHDGFIFFRPKDIVSGDFYWLYRLGDKILIASVDCTGHGVPGAFMSLIANNKLQKVVHEIGVDDPAAILTMVNSEIIEALNQEKNYATSHDGMEMSICVVDRNERRISFAGAHSGALLFEGGGVTEMKADAQSIGGTIIQNKNGGSGNSFHTGNYSYNPGALLYLFTDGFMDQFGGSENKKLNKSNFRGVLQQLSTESLSKAKEICDGFLNEWRGSHPQLDDILLIGVRL